VPINPERIRLKREYEKSCEALSKLRLGIRIRFPLPIPLAEPNFASQVDFDLLLKFAEIKVDLVGAKLADDSRVAELERDLDALLPIAQESLQNVQRARHGREPGIVETLERLCPELKSTDDTREVKSATTGSQSKTKTNDIFVPSEDYRSILFKDKPYTLTRGQSVIVKLLHQAHLKGTPDLDKQTLLSAIEAETSQVKDSFRNSPLWKELIVSRRRGTYRLNIA
jgi:hypothetical protein